MKRKVLDHLGLYTLGDWLALGLLVVLAGALAVIGTDWFHGWSTL